MMSTIARLWRNQRIILIAFIVAVGTAGYFGIKSASAYVYWMDPAHQDQRIEGWMTPRYIANSYKIPRDVLGEALFLSTEAPKRPTKLSTIASENGLTLEELQDRIDSATAAHRAEKEGQE